MTHWTSVSSEDFGYFVASDFMTQIELKLEADGIENKQFANMIGVDPSRVSQLLHNPGNLQIDTMVKCTRALGMKFAIVTYEDGDPQNVKGPISGDIFKECWEKMQHPRNTFDLENKIVTQLYPVHQHTFYRSGSNPYRPNDVKASVYMDSASLAAYKGGFVGQQQGQWV